MVAAAPQHVAAPHHASPAVKGTFLKTLARAPGPARDWRSVLDRYGRFQLYLPSDWVEQAPEGYGESFNLVVGEATPRDSFNANLIVTQQMGPEHLTVKAKDVDEAARKRVSDNKKYRYALKEKGLAKVGGVPCGILSGTMEMPGRTVRSTEVFTAYRGMFYIVTFTCLEKYHPQYEPLFARFLKSLVFERPDGTWPTPSPEPSPSPKPSAKPFPSPSPRPSARPSPSPSASPSP